MTTANTTDLVAAIASLSGALETVERMSGAHDEEIAKLNTERKTYLAKAAGDLLPAINKRVLADLHLAKAPFVTAEILKAFKDNRKFLGIFAGPGYDHALSMLQTRLASYLDETKHGDLKAKDAKIAELSQRIEHLRAQGKETRELLKLLDQALKKSLPLPPQVTEHVGKIANSYRARQKKSAHYTSGQSRTSHPTQVQVHEIDDYNDVMMYMATGFPTSTRTLLWDLLQTQQESTVEIIRGGGGSFGGGGASGDWSSSNTPDATGSQDFGSSAASSAMAVGAGVAAVAVGSVIIANDGFGLNPSSDSSVSTPVESTQSIATDDSLGAYS